jgi:hypothetical protein
MAHDTIKFTRKMEEKRRSTKSCTTVINFTDVLADLVYTVMYSSTLLLGLFLLASYHLRCIVQVPTGSRPPAVRSQRSKPKLLVHLCFAGCNTKF